MEYTCGDSDGVARCTINLVFMLLHPFKIFEPYKNLLDIRMLTREDDVVTDTDIAHALGLSEIASLHQVHGNRCTVFRSASSRSEEADSLATDRKGLTLTIRFADCQNFIVFDPVKKILCLIHAGWKGVQIGAIPKAFSCLESEWGCLPRDMLVGAGPSLCMKCATFTNPGKEAPELASYIQGRCIDLNRAADDQFFSLGVEHGHFERMHECTLCHSDQYWAYRAGEDAVVNQGKRNCLAATLRMSSK